jgi:NTP pyrophosphatase (non-canonical NTP hydrolase)
MEIPSKIVEEIEYLLTKTQAKHGPLSDNMTFLGALCEEYHEVVDAVRTDENWKIRREALDVINVCLRRVIGMDEAGRC